jgi:hypothetical protein
MPIKAAHPCGQDNLKEDKSKREKKITELYIFGLMRNRDDVMIATANYF